MTGRDAAIELHSLDVEGVPGRAASFARTFEDAATAEQFDEYLRVLDLLYGNN
jgi:hypothetical protein